MVLPKWMSEIMGLEMISMEIEENVQWSSKWNEKDDTKMFKKNLKFIGVYLFYPLIE